MLKHLLIMILLPVLCLPVVAPASEADAPRVIVVTGTGEVTAQPDMATIRLGVTHRDADARDAMDRVSGDMRRIFETVGEFGIQPRDVQTASLRLDTIWEDRRANDPAPPRVSAFVARNDIAIRVRDFDRLGDLLDRLLRDGANRFSGVSFAVQRPAPLRDEARSRAVADARRKATLYAQAAGVRMGEVLEIREPGSASSPAPRMSRSEPIMAEAAMPVAGGELSFSARITILYAIAE